MQSCQLAHLHQVMSVLQGVAHRVHALPPTTWGGGGLVDKPKKNPRKRIRGPTGTEPPTSGAVSSFNRRSGLRWGRG